LACSLQVASWTSLLATRQKVTGISLSWAYSPSEFKILTSPDGANFVESACWRSSGGKDASYVEHVMFDAPLPVRAVAVVMRGARAWGYFGLNAVSIIAGSSPGLLVSGATSPGGELCVVGSGTGLSLKPCLDAIAAGTGEEIFQLSDDGVLLSGESPDACVVLADGDAAGGGRFLVSSCRTALEAEDGRAEFRMSSTGQLHLALGHFCMVARDAEIIATDCEEASRANNAGDKFSMCAHLSPRLSF
jgi:hypothetical protein